MGAMIDEILRLYSFKNHCIRDAGVYVSYVGKRIRNLCKISNWTCNLVPKQNSSGHVSLKTIREKFNNSITI